MIEKVGCVACKQSFTREQFIEFAMKKHNNKYTYIITSDVIACSDRIDIICKKHGKFNQSVNDHKSGRGCKKCGDEYKRDSTLQDRKDKFTKFFDLLYTKDKYDYEYNIEKYVDHGTIMDFYCRTHKLVFYQKPNNLLNGFRCKLCETPDLSIKKTQEWHDVKNKTVD